MAESLKTLEKGNIYFIYRPKFGLDEVTSFEDVEQLYCALYIPDQNIYRLLILGRKKSPSPTGEQERFWAFVSKVSNSSEDIKKEIEFDHGGQAGTKEREREQALTCGEGIYQLFSHKDHTHFVYSLQDTHDTDIIQRALNIPVEAGYIVSIKNPEEPSPRNAGLVSHQEAELPEELKTKFKGEKYHPLNPVDFINYEGVEILFNGIKVEQNKELEMDLDLESEASGKAIKNLQEEMKGQTIEPLLSEGGTL